MFVNQVCLEASQVVHVQKGIFLELEKLSRSGLVLTTWLSSTEVLKHLGVSAPPPPPPKKKKGGGNRVWGRLGGDGITYWQTLTVGIYAYCLECTLSPFGVKTTSGKAKGYVGVGNQSGFWGGGSILTYGGKRPWDKKKSVTARALMRHWDQGKIRALYTISQHAPCDVTGLPFWIWGRKRSITKSEATTWLWLQSNSSVFESLLSNRDLVSQGHDF